MATEDVERCGFEWTDGWGDHWCFLLPHGEGDHRCACDCVKKIVSSDLTLPRDR